MKKIPRAWRRRTAPRNAGARRRGGRTVLAVVLALLAGLAGRHEAAAQAADQSHDAGGWEVWKSVSYTLDAKASFQFRIKYDDIPVRAWKLVVDGGDELCDLSVLRVKGEELLYYKNSESNHSVLVPWGRGEEIIAVLTNRDRQASFTVNLLGPPRDQTLASYSYGVNRSLEAYAAGRRLLAEEYAREALKDDPDDAVAKVLLAGFRRDGHFYEEASELVEEALAGDLPPEMQELAASLRVELQELQAPLPGPVRDGVISAEQALGAAEYQRALEVCDDLLSGKLELRPESRARLHLLRGQALVGLDRSFEAIDAYTAALNFNRSKATEGIIYFHMGKLFQKMDNLTQAEGAFTMALQNGLPSGLQVQAREALRQVNQRLNEER